MPLKAWLSLDEQVDLMKARGLVIGDESFSRKVLQKVGYYHLSGYGRFFQEKPSHGLNNYKEGTTFEEISELQSLDAELRLLCLSALNSIELTLRAGFAYHFGRLVAPYGKLLDASTWHTSGARESVENLILRDLNYSKQPFLVRHRDNGKYDSLPVWVAVECMSFGTLSKAIEHCKDVDVVRSLASELGITRTGFSSQVRSFVALRNACAHSSRLWNDVAKNPPQVPNNIVHKAKKRSGDFDPHGYYQVFVAMDRFGGHPLDPQRFLPRIEDLIGENDLFRRGLMNPEPYA